MLIDEIRNIKGTKKELRKFGITMGGVLFLIGIFLVVKGKASYPYVMALVLALTLLGSLIPHLLKPFYFFWMGLATVMGFVMTRVILVLLYYLVFTPMALFMKMRGKDLLSRKYDGMCESYWVRKDNKAFNKERYTKQY